MVGREIKELFPKKKVEIPKEIDPTKISLEEAQNYLKTKKKK